MKKTVCAGVLALATLVLLFNVPQSRAAGSGLDAVQSETAASINIGRI